MTPTLIECFGIALRQSREAKSWSQEQLAGHSNLNRSYVGEIERGRAIASLATVEKLALALGISPSALVSRGEEVSHSNVVRCIRLMAIAC